MEIYVLVLDRLRNIAGLNQLIYPKLSIYRLKLTTKTILGTELERSEVQNITRKRNKDKML